MVNPDQHPNAALIEAVEAHKTTLDNLVIGGSRYECPALTPCELYPFNDEHFALARRLPESQSVTSLQQYHALVGKLPFLQIYSRTSFEFPHPDADNQFIPAVAASFQPRPLVNEGWSVTVNYKNIMVPGTDHQTLAYSEGGVYFNQSAEVLRAKLRPIAVYVGRTVGNGTVIKDDTVVDWTGTFTLLPLQAHQRNAFWKERFEAPEHIELRSLAIGAVHAMGKIYEGRTPYDLANEYYTSGFSA